jgi:serine/threonine-protein kinase
MTEPPPLPPPGPGDPTVPLPVEQPLEPPPPPGPYPPGPPLEEPPPSRQLWPWLLLLLLLVLGGLAALLFATHHGKKHSTIAAATKPVPAVVGLTKQAATAKVTQAGFNAQIRFVPSAKPKNQVVAQAPQAGAKLSTGGAVSLTVSSGPPKQGVPNVVGLKAAAAIGRLQTAHLGSREQLVFASAAPGTVVKQTPPAGAVAKKGATVLLAVSKGPQRVAVPAVVGQKRTDATAALKKAGFVPAVFSVPSTGPQGVVVAQNPQPGAKAPKGSRVRLNVSQGAPGTTATVTSSTTTTPPANVTVPNVVGKKQLAAQRRLRAASLGVRSVYVASTQPSGTVVAQRPAAGSTAKRGSRVRINVSTGPNPRPLKTVPDVTGEDEATATADLQAAGFQVQSFDEPTTDPNQDRVVIDEDPAGGMKAPAGSQVAIYVGRASG